MPKLIPCIYIWSILRKLKILSKQRFLTAKDRGLMFSFSVFTDDGCAHFRFPRCTGTIDGNHITIQAPGRKINQYRNRIFFCFRGQCITVADSSSQRSAGEIELMMHSCSNLCSAMDSGVNVPVLMITNSAYPMLCWLMKPYRNIKESKFNQKVYRACKCCWASIRVLKGN